MSQDQLQSNRFAPVVVIPTFNNAPTLSDVLARTARLGVPVIVVNDGSTDRTGEILRQFPQISVLSHSGNLGKAAALRSGFAQAAGENFTHALTIDADDQHDPQLIPALLDLAVRQPDAVILGVRDDQAAGYPRLSRLGRRVSNLLVWMESGENLRDSQCGLRVYPLDWVHNTPCGADRYGYETEILTRAAWVHRPIVQTPVNCRYFTGSQRVSHFQPVRDSLRAALMHGRLLAQSLRYLPRRAKMHLSPRRIWQQLRTEHAARRGFAAGLALGVFIACLPIFGLQGVLSLLVARRLKLNSLSALAGSQVSTPPIGVAVIAISVAAGHLLLHGTWPDPALWHITNHTFRPLTMMRTLFWEWTVGGIAVGSLLSFLTYVITRATLSLSRRRS
jgi:glycosyltransferase involved in cell wall biosynthesis